MPKNFYIFLVTKKISKTFNILTKYETESLEKDSKFWEHISKLKISLVDILDESKF